MAQSPLHPSASKTTASVAGRAALAVGLMVGFYALALLISAALIYLPYAEFAYAHRIHPKLAFACLIGAGTILSAIWPRRDRFEAPGPTLEPARHPDLFAEIEGVASATGQAMPAEVFLVGDVNAWVAQRGGAMGFFSRRVMGLGLPLLQMLSISELRAVLAHEFGHFHGGDTKLGPWIYKTRSAIGRTIAGLGNSLLQAPFRWYGNLFLRISHAVSRRQEFSADALASRVIGSRPLCEGLKKVRAAAVAYDTFWSEEIVPVLRAGFLPPIADGFRRFSSHARVSKAMAGVIEQGLTQTETDPYDTHPPLSERIAAVSHLPAGPDPTTEPSAISLLSDLSELERSWLATVADPATVQKLEQVGWDSVVSNALLPAWRGVVQDNAALLGAATVADLARLISDRDPTRDEEREAFVRWLAAAATTLALQRDGWTIDAPPGAAFAARRDGAEVHPFEVVQKLADGSLTAESWAAESARLAIGRLPLAG